MHFSVLVIIEDQNLLSARGLAGAVEVLMDPYNEDAHQTERIEEDGEVWHSNPEGRWDWYMIGGRWANTLQVGAGAEAWKVVPDPTDRLARELGEGLAYSRLMEPVGPEGGPADIARKRDVDLEAIAMAKVQRATDAWNEAQERFAKTDQGDVDFLTDVRRDETLEDLLRRWVRPATWYIFLDSNGWDSQNDRSYSTLLGIEELKILTNEERRALMAQDQLEWEGYCIRRWTEIPDDAWVAVVDIHT